MKKFFGEFKKFISRGNVMDMAVGMIIGSAFTAIVTALSNGILKPLINWVISLCAGGDSDALSQVYTYLVTAYKTETIDGVETQVIDLANSIYIDWGAFISAIINFLLIAIVLFSIVKTFNKVKEMNESTVKKLKSKKKLKPEEQMALEEALKREEEEAKQKALEEERLAKMPTTDDLLQEILSELKKGK